MCERRRLPRLRVLKGAKLILERHLVLDCVVRNLTGTGARVEIPNSIDLPETFELTLDRGHTVRPCRVVWRGLSGVGVEFPGIN